MKNRMSLLKVLLTIYFLSLAPTTVGFTFPSVVDEVRKSMMPLFAGTLEIKPKSDFNCSTTPIKEYRFKLLTYPPRSTPSNSFLEVLDKVEKVAFEAESSSSRPSKAKLDALTKNIKLALKERSFLFAREALGKALYMALALGKRSGRVKRSTSNPGKIYLDKLKKEIGEDKFGNLLGVKDEKTLIFAIDDTGSMGGEIKAVKDITKEIVKTRGTSPPVDYILSVFNDPNTGPVIYKDDTQGAEFVKEVDKLSAHGGGDYPELTFKGMIAAMLKDPQEGSPMFVFTDATAKDATSKRKDELIKYATNMKVNINFITTSSAASFKPFIEVAKATCGMILKLLSSSEIKKLTKVAKLMLNSFACASSGTVKPALSGKGKRSATTRHFIPIDDSVEKVLISVSTERPNPIIRLKNPRGRDGKSVKISLYYGAIYEIKNPDPGRWTLLVGIFAGKYNYVVRGLSSTNIDFDYYFVAIPRAGRKPVTVSQPLAGKDANAIITVTGVDKVRASSLSIQVVDSATGRVLKTAATKPRGRSKAHFLVTFKPPSTPFKLKMKGKTKAGSAFERSSRKEIQATTALIRVHSAKDGQLTIPRGKRSYVIMMVYNTGPTERFNIVVSDPHGFAISRRNRRIQVRKNRSRRFSIWFQANSSAKPGMADPAAVTIVGRTSGVKTGQVINLIVV